MSSKKKKPVVEDEPAVSMDDGDGDGEEELGAAEQREADLLEARKSRSKKADRSANAKAQWKEAEDAKKSGKRRIDQLMSELNEDDQDVFDTVTDQTYKSLVASRRAEDSFVEDDGVAGYGDDGEEIFGDGSEAGSTKKQKTEKDGTAKKRKSKKPVPKPALKGTISGMFKGKSDSKQLSKEELAKQQHDLDDMLNKLKDEDEAGEVKPQKKQESVLEMAISSKFDTVLDTDELHGLIPEGPTTDEFFVPDEDAAMKEYAISVPKAGSSGSVQVPAAAKPNQFDIRGMKDSKSNASSATMRALPPVADDDSADTPSDWGAVSKQTTGMEASTPTAGLHSQPSSAASPVAGKTDLTAPLQNGKLRMYWFDAYEDPHNNPGFVYVFGKAMMPAGVSGSGGAAAATSIASPPVKNGAAPAKGPATAASGAGFGDSKRTESVAIRVGPISRSIYVLPRPKKLSSAKDENSVTGIDVTMRDVYDEMKLILNGIGVTKFSSKEETKKYCFEQERTADGNPSVPPETKYLRILYDAKSPALPIDARGKTFSRIFGTRASALELFLLERDLMGPSWLEVTDCVPPSAGQFSYCKYDFDVKTSKSVSVIKDAPDAPPFRVLSLSIKTLLNPKTHRNELVMASGLVHQSVSVDASTVNPNALTNFTVARPPEGVNWPFDLKQVIASEAKKNNGKIKLHLTPNEAGLLGFLCAQIHKIDPDVLIGHELHGYTLEVLLQRMQARNISQWSKLGRLKKTKLPNMSSKGGFTLIDRGVLTGRLLVDSRVSAQELIHEKTYTLTHLAQVQLKTKRKDVDITKIPAMFDTTQNVYALVDLNCNDAFLALSLSHKLQVLPLTKQLTCLCGNLWSNSLRSKRADRVEFLLLHEFYGRNFIPPEKLSGMEKKEKAKARKKGGKKGAGGSGGGDDMDDGGAGMDDDDEDDNTGSKKRRKKAQYSGGLVLEPKKGFYDKFVLLLDFNSLYPSIIREFNVCFTTVKHWNVMSGQISELPDASTPGILPAVVKVLLEKRRSVKKLAKTERNAAKKQELDIRQKALKLVANSMYGCLGFTNSRFFCEPLASLITSQGRDILMRTKEQTEALSYNVIYGDTDSIMVFTNETDLDKVKSIGAKIKGAVNKKFKFLEIDIDGIFQSMLLLKKKKYAAVKLEEREGAGPDGKPVVTGHREAKGLDLVRRDWCQLSKDVGNYVLDQILSGKPREEVVDFIHTHLRQVRDDLKANKISLDKFVITKGLTKALTDYPDAKSQPHVLVGQWMQSKGMAVRVGDHIPYIICEQKDVNQVSARAHHPKEIADAKGALPIDINWYLSSQVLPPVARLCAPIEETNAAQIADCLGLDARQFHSYGSTPAARAADGDEDDEPILAAHQNDEERFKRCQKFEVTCHKCAHKWQLTGVFDFARSTRAAGAALSAAGLLASTQTPTGGSGGGSAMDTKDGATPTGNATTAGGPVVSLPVPAVSGLSCPSGINCPGLVEHKHDVIRVSTTLINQLTLEIRAQIAMFYDAVMQCDDPACGRRSRQLTVRGVTNGGVACIAPKCQGKMYPRYSSAELYNQLMYYSSLFDTAHARDSLQAENKRRRDASLSSTAPPLPQLSPVINKLHEEVFANVHTYVESVLERNAYCYVQLASIFKPQLHAAS